MTTCQHSHAIASTTLVDQHTVWLCRECRSVRIDDEPAWQAGGSGCLDQLRARVMLAERARNIDAEMRYSPIEDPRWTRLDMS